jgi:hypothetical protein
MLVTPAAEQPSRRAQAWLTFNVGQNMAPSHQNKNATPVAWAEVAESAKYEDCIIGNRAGLEALRSKVEEAIQKGTAELPEHITNSMRVVLVESPHNPEHEPKKKTWRDIAGVIGFGVFLLAILAIFLVGVMTISGWMK